MKKANWEFYEPRTEHGSSLSPCVYALVAAAIGKPEWAYRYFLKTATVDLDGNSKQYVGNLYIGGTHPAANGGAWMAAVLGFAGARVSSRGLFLDPRLPQKWKALEFKAAWMGQRLSVRLSRGTPRLLAEASNQKAFPVFWKGGKAACRPGQALEFGLNVGAERKRAREGKASSIIIESGRGCRN